MLQRQLLELLCSLRIPRKALNKGKENDVLYGPKQLPILCWGFLSRVWSVIGDPLRFHARAWGRSAKH